MLVVCSDIHVLGSKLMSAEVTRMQDLASEFSKISGWHPGPPQREGATISSTHHQPSKRPGVGTQTLVPLNFSAVVAPLVTTASDLSLNRHIYVSSRDKFLLAPPLEASSSYTVGEDAGLFLGHIARRLLQLGYIGVSRIKNRETENGRVKWMTNKTFLVLFIWSQNQGIMYLKCLYLRNCLLYCTVYTGTRICSH